MSYDIPATKDVVEKTIEALNNNGINALYVENANEVKAKVLAMIPEGSEVMTMTSVTLDSLGISQEINESGKYNSVKAKLWGENDLTKNEKNKLGSAPEYALGSVHAVTQNGEIIIASNTGSQLPAYAYGAMHVIWVVGTQKIVSDLDSGMQRLEKYTLPLESERARKAYGTEGSNISKLLIIKKEVNPERLHLIFVGENLGF